MKVFQTLFQGMNYRAYYETITVVTIYDVINSGFLVIRTLIKRYIDVL